MYPSVSILLLLLSCLSFSAQAQVKYAVVQEDGIWKVIDTNGNTITDSLLKTGEELRDFSEGVIVYSQNYKFGLRDMYGKQLTPCQFSSVSGFKNGVAVVSIDKNYPARIANIYKEDVPPAYKYGLINKQGRFIADTVYDNIKADDDSGIVVLVKKDTLALMNTQGQFILPFSGYAADAEVGLPLTFSNGLLPVTTFDRYGFFPHHAHNRKVGFIDRRGRLVVDTVYELYPALGSRRHDLSEASWRGGMCGTGYASASRYASAHPYYLKPSWYSFSGGRCLVSRNGVSMVINTSGDSVFAFAYGREVTNMDGFFWQMPLRIFDEVRGEPQLFDKNGKLIPIKDFTLEKIWHNLLVIKHNNSGKYQLMSANGKLIGKELNYIDKEVGHYLGSSHGYIDSMGNIVPFHNLKYTKQLQKEGYNLSYSWPGGLIPVSMLKYDTYINGIIDNTGNWVVPAGKYSFSSPVNGYFTYRVDSFNGRYGYYSDKGRKITHAKYKAAYPFQTIK